MRDHPEYRESVRLLMVGNGPRLAAVEADPQRRRAGRRSSPSPGLVAQEEGPHYLAACDMLASPHVRNPDGTPFFGSPTKLFEYMAMGKGIVASDLDQIGEVLRHGETAWMVPPGDPECAGRGLARLSTIRICGDAWRGRARERARAAHLARPRAAPTLDSAGIDASAFTRHEAAAGDQLGNAAAVRSARRAGQPDAEAPGPPGLAVVGRMFRTAVEPLQPGSRSWRRGSLAPEGVDARPGSVARGARVLPSALACRCLRSSGCPMRSGSGSAPRRARR